MYQFCIVKNSSKMGVKRPPKGRWRETEKRFKYISNRKRLLRAFESCLWITVWRNRWDSNPRPLAWQASVLTNWTTAPEMVGGKRLKLLTNGLKVRYSFNWVNRLLCGFYNPPQSPTPLRCGDQGNKKNKKCLTYKYI